MATDDLRHEVPVSVLLETLPDKQIVGTPPVAVAGIADDSRQVRRDDCFVAMPGFKSDGRRFVAQAVERGASLVVTEGEAPAGLAVATVLVPSARAALGRLADAYYGHPSRDLTLVGITGTNGKTTTSYLVEALLRALGLRTGVLGTIQYVLGDERRPAGQTTPEALALHSMLARMRDHGVRAVAMEVSSHALALARVDELAFDVAVFTNLTQDHLDFHGTFDTYRVAKRHLFELLSRSTKPRPTAVVNADDPSGAAMTRGLPLPVLTFGLSAGADIRALRYESTLTGIRLIAVTPRGQMQLASPLIGEHNVMNLLGAIATGIALGSATMPSRGRSAGGRRSRALRAGARRPAVPRRRRLRPHARRARARARDGAQADDRPPRRGLRLRRRPRPRQAADHGRDRGAARRPRVGHLGQSPLRAARGDHRRDRRRRAARGGRWAAVGGRSRSPRGDRPGAGLGAGRRHRGDRGKGHETYQIVGSDVLPFDDRAVAHEILRERGA